MNKKILFLSILITFLDLFTTYVNMVLYNTCLLERNPILVHLCMYNPLLIFLWMSIETSIIYFTAVALRHTRIKMKVKLPVEHVFLVLCLAPAVNNTIWIIRFFLLLHSHSV